MARLSETQWALARAEYEVKNLSNREIADKFGVTEGAIRKRAALDFWVKGQSAHLVEKKLKVISDLEAISTQSTNLSTQHLQVIDDDVSFRLQNNKDLQSIQKVVNAMISAGLENPTHALALMSATVKHREARLGKSPETAIQINNGISPRDITDDDLADIIASSRA